MLNQLKDNALSLAIKTKLNERFADYGEVVDCVLDTRHNKLRLDAKLRGEKELMHATIERYDLERLGDDHFVILRRFSSSRAWLTTLLGAIFTGKRYKIPRVLSKLL